MVGGVERQNAFPAGRQQSGLQGDLDRVGPGDRKVHLCIIDGYVPQQLPGQLRATGMGMDIRQAVKETTGLVADCGNHRLVSMTHRRDPEPGGQIHEAVAVHIEDIGSECFLPDEGGAVGSEGVDAGGLTLARLAGQSTRSGTGRRAENARSLIAAP
jgi:hypothetical protein